MYEHEGKLLFRDDAGVFHSCYVTATEEGGCKVTLLEQTFDHRPHGATPTAADALMRRLHLNAGESYPAQPKVEPAPSTTAPVGVRPKPQPSAKH